MHSLGDTISIRSSSQRMTTRGESTYSLTARVHFSYQKSTLHHTYDPLIWIDVRRATQETHSSLLSGFDKQILLAERYSRSNEFFRFQSMLVGLDFAHGLMNPNPSDRVRRGLPKCQQQANNQRVRLRSSTLKHTLHVGDWSCIHFLGNLG
jgi:hypothetical protein